MSDQKIIIPEGTVVLQIDTPFCSPAEYARRSGRSKSAVSSLISSGSSKIVVRKKESRQGAVEINLAATLVRALGEADIDVVVVE